MHRSAHRSAAFVLPGRRAGRVLSAGALAGCAPNAQSVTAPNGPAAERLLELSWVLFAMGGAVLALVVVLLLYAVFRRRRPPLPPAAAADRRATRWIVIGGVVFPAVVLSAFFPYVLRVQRETHQPPEDAVLTIEVRGYRWWWAVRYLSDDGQPAFETANEIRIPVGQPVRVRLASADVIHSFWVPRLQGKLDMIPGRVNETWIQADAPGVYRGQCAEYCGHQHAKMAFLVVAEPPDSFAAWYARQLRPAAEPSDPRAARGRSVFLGSGCAACHTIRGTRAAGTLGPDLTHVGSRLTLAAATVANTPGHLGGWIADPQSIKPGSLMPATPLAPADLGALVHYLEMLE